MLDHASGEFFHAQKYHADAILAQELRFILRLSVRAVSAIWRILRGCRMAMTGIAAFAMWADGQTERLQNSSGLFASLRATLRTVWV